MERTTYARGHRERYLRWGEKVAASPYSPCAKAEFALISAHTPMNGAIEGFLEVQKHATPEGIKWALLRTGVFAPAVKAERLYALRKSFRTGQVTFPTGRALTFRADAPHIVGLGPCKLSFALALSSPFESDVCCIDAHIAREYNIKVGSLGRLRYYEQAEDLLRGEAGEVGLPTFLYQWAVWDYVRGRDRLVPPEDHSFLWREGRTHFQRRLM